MTVASRIGMKRNYNTPVMHIIKLSRRRKSSRTINVRSGFLLLGIFILFVNTTWYESFILRVYQKIHAPLFQKKL
jgi:hypothetical protein